MNTGATPHMSQAGLITTVAYQFGETPAAYALEGSIAITGALIQWLRDSLGLVREAAEVDALAETVADNGGVYIVPAFSGLYAPYWRADARGIIAGLTRYAGKAHLCRAALEAAAYQTFDVVTAMEQDAGVKLTALRVDGGMVRSAPLMQFQADMLGTEVVRPRVTETTALGAAYAAGLAVGLWPDTQALRGHWQAERRWQPAMDGAVRARHLRGWEAAVRRSLGWVEGADAT
jgi:glycerol kinase